MKEVKNLIISAPNHATGYRLSDGFYIEWFSGSKSEGWSLISSSHHDIRSVDTSKPVIEKQKPRTNTGFVKCEFEKLSDLVLAFESGDELYYEENTTGYKYELDMYGAISMHKHSEKLYRKVETEIDERQEFIDAYKNLASVSMPLSIDDWAGLMYDSGKFKLVDSND